LHSEAVEPVSGLVVLVRYAISGFGPASDFQPSYPVFICSKGHAMKRTQICFAVVASILVIASCASGPQVAQLNPFYHGEAMLTDIQMPEYVREDLSYNVILAITSEETPQIKRVCFRWVTQEISSYSPSLSCYAMNGTFALGNGPCGPSTASPGPSSSSFCFDSSEINTDVPGRLTVKMVPTGLKASYNMLEGQVEYVSKSGEVRMTNSVRTPVTVEQ
jgi:hypothetical protein